jgi:hypothetical protein
MARPFRRRALCVHGTWLPLHQPLFSSAVGREGRLHEPKMTLATTHAQYRPLCRRAAAVVRAPSPHERTMPAFVGARFGSLSATTAAGFQRQTTACSALPGCAREQCMAASPAADASQMIALPAAGTPA